MDVLIIGDYDPSNIKKGGTYTHTRYWCDFLLKNTKISFGIISDKVFYLRNGNNLNKKEEFKTPKIIKSNLIKRLIFYQNFYKNILSKYKPKIFHVHSTNAISKKILFLAKKKYIKLVLSVHGIIAEERKYWPKLKKSINGRIYGNREELSLTHADWIIVDTQYVRKCLNEHYNIDNTKISTIPLGVDNNWFQINRKQIKNNILTVGGIENRKGFHYLIESCGLLKKDKIKFNLNICGRIRNINYYNSLKEKISMKNLKSFVNFKLDLSDEELIEEYIKADIFVLPSLEESQGIVLVEAMAIGIPIVASKAGGIPYIVKNHRNGLIVEKGNHFLLYKALKKILTSSVMKDKMSKTNKQDSLLYTAEHTNKQILQIYNKFIR